MFPLANVVDVTVTDSPCHTAMGNFTPGAECSLGMGQGDRNPYVAWDGVTIPDRSSYGADH